MRKLVVLFAALAVISFAPAVLADGTDTENMSVSANVHTSCVIDSASELAFGTYDNSAISTTSTILVTCVAADAKAALALGDGENWIAGAGAPQPRRLKSAQTADHFLTYNLKVTNASGTCWGGTNTCSTAHSEDVTQNAEQQTFTVYGSIPASQGLYAGSYSDSVLVTVTF